MSEMRYIVATGLWDKKKELLHCECEVQNALGSCGLELACKAANRSSSRLRLCSKSC